MPTVDGFDVFLGNLDHLNAEQEPESLGLSQGPRIQSDVRPARRNELQSHDDGQSRRRTRASAPGKQIEETGPLNIKRMETVDEEITKGALQFMDKSAQQTASRSSAGNSSRMHIWTHLKPESPKEKPASEFMPDGMVEHDSDGRTAARPS